MEKGRYTQEEITSQPRIWQEVLEAARHDERTFEASADVLAGRPLVIAGCGSTHYLSIHLSAMYQQLGISAVGLPSSEVVFFSGHAFAENAALLVVSRSGTTTESLWAMDTFQGSHPNSPIAAITCVPGTPMLAKAQVRFVAHQAQERSVAQTRSFTSMGLLGHLLAGLLTRQTGWLDRLSAAPAALDALFTRHSLVMEQLGRDLTIDRVFFLGQGPYYGIACEAMLKTKEMSQSWSEAFHTLEYRHGPVAVAGPGAFVVGFVSDRAMSQEVQVLREMREKGARTLAFCERKGAGNWQGVDEVIEVESGLNELDRALLYLPLMQQFAFHRALAKGLDPDNPPNLTSVVRLEPGEKA